MILKRQTKKVPLDLWPYKLQHNNNWKFWTKYKSYLKPLESRKSKIFEGYQSLREGNAPIFTTSSPRKCCSWQDTGQLKL